MNIEALRMWSRHDQGHASTYLSLEDARLIVEVYDYLEDASVNGIEYAPLDDLLERMRGV